MIDIELKEILKDLLTASNKDDIKNILYIQLYKILLNDNSMSLEKHLKIKEALEKLRKIYIYE